MFVDFELMGLDNVTVALINPPPELVLRFGLIKGWGSQSYMMAVAVGLDSAARPTSSTNKRKSSKIGIFRAGKIYYCHPFIIAIWT